MATVYLKDTTLTSIGNAIREKTGETAKLLPSEMANAIASISGGGGSSGLILPENGDHVIQMSGSSNEEFIYLDTNINLDNIKLVSFYTSRYAGYSADYNTGFFYLPEVCRHWKDGWGCDCYSLIAVGTATNSRYNYMGFSCDLNNGYNYKYQESNSYPMEYCYLCIDGTSGHMAYGCTLSYPAPDGYTFENSDVNFKSLLSKNGPFILIYGN